MPILCILRDTFPLLSTAGPLDIQMTNTRQWHFLQHSSLLFCTYHMVNKARTNKLYNYLLFISKTFIIFSCKFKTTHLRVLWWNPDIWYFLYWIFRPVQWSYSWLMIFPISLRIWDTDDILSACFWTHFISLTTASTPINNSSYGYRYWTVNVFMWFGFSCKVISYGMRVQTFGSIS